MSGGLAVTGGADGIEARTADLSTAARLLRAGAAAIDAVTEACAGPLWQADPGFGGRGFLEHARIAAALDAVRRLAEALRALADVLTFAATRYATAEERVLARLWDGITETLDLGWRALTLPTEFEYRLLQSGGRFGEAVDRLITNDPGVADVLMPATVLSPLLGLGMLALQSVPDGTPVVRATGPDTAGCAAAPPRGLADLLRELDHRYTGPDGAIDVRILSGTDGRRRVIADLPGTRELLSVGTGDVNDLTTNARALIGRDGTYEQGVFEALRAAGVGPDDEIMLVGHSQGGMVAIDAARDAARNGFTITHVVTAGSPIGLTVGQLPRGIQVLALENRRDVVPRLDGRDNPDRLNVVTVGFDPGPGTVGTEHAISTSYLGAAAMADASDDPAIRAFLDSADGFFRADRVDTGTYAVSRGG